MKKHLPLLLFAFLFLLVPALTDAQEITTVAGVGTEGWTGDKGPARSAELDWPTSVALDRKGNLYIADANNNIIRKVSASNGIITTVAGNGFRAGTGYGSFSGDSGPATAATLFFPSGIAVDTVGRLYIADEGNNCIRKVDTSGIIITIAGTGGAGNFGYSGDGGPAIAALLNGPTRVAVDTFLNVYIADASNSAIRELNILTGNIATIAGTGVSGFGGDGGLATAAQLNMPNDVAVDLIGNVYIADMYNNRIREIGLNDTITTIAGTGISGYSGDHGPATAADLFQPSGIALDDSGNVFFSDLGNSCVRKINRVDTITTIAGNDTAGYNGDSRAAVSAKLWFPEGLAAVGYDVYIADRGNFRIRELIPTLLGVNTISKSKSSINVFPNPGQGYFSMTINTITDEEAHVMITNLTGEEVNNVDARTNTMLHIQLNQPAGMYFISAVTAHGVLNEKLIIN